ncbi:hypothetical protein P5673_025302 [Acropora cervicornis]|uniref:Uncharacterized protein n=1 Tax=Acropora cervicornis TaxID=6130 RepID=A0AAD9Q273_ACRCE|nr:hypothetical protein P5673_025302 [Acropora cervicornis]
MASGNSGDPTSIQTCETTPILECMHAKGSLSSFDEDNEPQTSLTTLGVLVSGMLKNLQYTGIPRADVPVMF